MYLDVSAQCQSCSATVELTFLASVRGWVFVPTRKVELKEADRIFRHACGGELWCYGTPQRLPLARQQPFGALD